MSRKRLGQVLVERGALSQKRLDEVLEMQDRPERLGEFLVAHGLVSKGDVSAALESVTGVPRVAAIPESVDEKALGLIPVAVAHRCRALPLAVEGKTLVVAMAEPQNMLQVEELQFCSGMTVSARFAFLDDILGGIERCYSGFTPAPAGLKPHVTGQVQLSGPQPMGWLAITVALLLAFALGIVMGHSM